MSRLIPRTLTARLVLTAVALVALVSVLLAGATTVAMNTYLNYRLDQQLAALAGRAMPQGPGRPGPDHDHDGRDDFRGPRGLGTLLVNLDTGEGGIVNDDNVLTGLSSDNLRELSQCAGDQHTCALNGLGNYRILVDRQSEGTFIYGLPTNELDASISQLLAVSMMLSGLGIALAGGLGTLLVRRQLRPLRAVAATADNVAHLPLSQGEQSTQVRVPQKYTDERTEVGQVGSALNTLLDHVDSALAARHRSEQQVRQFVADASHELRTPLSTIHGYAELSRRTSADAEALGLAMHKVETEATRMSALVEDLLLLARLDSGRPLERSEVDLTRLLLEATEDAKVVAPDHQWRLDLPQEPVTMMGDSQRLHQVITNLLTNARRHTCPGTVVTVGASSNTDAVQFWVHDNGPGVPVELQADVFERFTRGDSSRTRASGGAGLGLSLVQAIVASHHGHVGLSSAPGDTTFTVTLPR